MRKFYILMIMMCLTTNNYAQTLTNTGPTDDFDGDGVTNENDLDDDNDGIPDDVESICEAYVTNYVSGSPDNITDPASIIAAPDNDYTVFDGGSSAIIVDFGQVLTSGTTLYFEAYKSGTADKILNIQSSNSDGTTLGATGDITITNNQDDAVPDQEFVLTEDSRYFRLYRSDGYSTNIYIDAILHQDGQNCQLTDLTDEDIDGIPDKFDLDSDNDGCPDSLEGGGTQVLLSQIYINATNTDPYQNGMMKGPYTNGLANTVGNGNNLGTSESPFDQSSECQYWCSDPNGPDTDGDGRGDKCDVDDDNDGILDVDEGLTCTMFNNFFDGQRTYTGGGDINDAQVNGVMILEKFVREVDSNGVEVPNGQSYDLRVELTDIYQPPGSTFDQRVDFQWSSSTSVDELVVFYGGPPTDNPHIKMTMTFLDDNQSPIGVSDATIRFSDIDSNDNTNFTDLVGVLNTDGQLTSSGPVLPKDISLIEEGGFAYGPFSQQIIDVNTNYDIYRLKKESSNSNGPWYSAENEIIPNPTFNVTAGFRFDQFNSLNVVYGYTTDDPSASTTTNLSRGLAFSRDDFELCVFTDTDKDGIPNEEDLDSDGDGCPDLIEGAGAFTNNDVVIANTIPGGNNYDGSTTGVYTGIVTIPSYETLGYGQDSSNSYGIPTEVNGIPTPDDLTGTQNAGASQDINVNGCACEKNSTAPSIAPENSLVGITSIERDNNSKDEVVTQYSNGFLALESTSLGFVPSRIGTPENVFDSNNSTNQADDDAVEGMMVWDTDKNCLRLFDGTVWRCIKRSCDEPTTYTP